MKYVITVVIIAATVIFSVWMNGGMFGMRCERAYRGDNRAFETCVDRLVHGGKVYVD